MSETTYPCYTCVYKDLEEKIYQDACDRCHPNGYPYYTKGESVAAQLATAKEENKRAKIAINIAIHLICSDDDFGGDAQIRGIKILEQVLKAERT